MKWIKIEEGCEMPSYREFVALVQDGGLSCGYWTERGCWDDGGYHDQMHGITHWARVELPEE